MNAIQKYVANFFSEFYMDADMDGHSYKVLIEASVQEFLSVQNKSNAYSVYNMFFDIYRTNRGYGKSFIDLLDVLKTYEENTGALSDEQRDHYIHSVNVFILGLCVYSKNENFRNSYVKHCNAVDYSRMFSTEREEFFFCWGIASLYHDIGYPIEIINNQAKKFISLIANNEYKEIGPFVSYINFNKLNHIQVGEDKVSSCSFKESPELDLRCPTDLLAGNLSKRLSLPLEQIKGTLDDFLHTMQINGFVDHGFYSALIILKWYGEEIIGSAPKEDVFFNQITDSAAAVFLHNAYKNILIKKPYSKSPMNVLCHPLAYLLILCDEAQEWNRETYGSYKKSKVFVDDTNIYIDNNQMKLHYITRSKVLEEGYPQKKKELFLKLLDIFSVFGDGISITATTLSEQYIDSIKESSLLPRLLVNDIEALAIKIHENYNKTQKERHPETELKYPSWDSLPDTLKYSNVRQAATIVDKLKLIDCYVDKQNSEKATYVFSDTDVELLARFEHDLWVDERVQNGWIFGEEKDIEKKISPYIKSYDELSEEVKELDRDTIRNIPLILAEAKLNIYKNETAQ